MLGTFFTLTPANIISTTDTIFNLIEDLKPFLILLIGIILGNWLLSSIVNTLRERTERRAYIEKIEEEEERRIFKPYHEHEKEIIRERVREKLFKEA